MQPRRKLAQAPRRSHRINRCPLPAAETAAIRITKAGDTMIDHSMPNQVVNFIRRGRNRIRAAAGLTLGCCLLLSLAAGCASSASQKAADDATSKPGNEEAAF